MSDQPTLEEFTQALEDLPPEFKAQLATVVQPPEEVDTVAIKLELVKFVTELQKHNQGVDWETNKVKPKSIRISKVIEEATELFNFLLE
tara:strand:+ start:276 stop:542 length:267 start_codon:yes stop_codon:yes gene_type:complete